MSWRTRCIGLTLLFGLLAALLFTDAQAQPLPDVPRFDFNPPNSFITLPSDPNLKKRFDAIPDYIEAGLWSEAVKSLQSLLDVKEDVFVPLARKLPDGKPVLEWRSVRTEANRLLGGLPRPAREFYELSFGPAAAALLAEARTRNDPQLLAQVGQRYFYTEAGAEATRLLGTYHLDRGRYLMAALCFEKLSERVGPEKLTPLDLFRATLAFHRAGDRAGAEQTWKRLSEKAGHGLRLGERTLALAELEKVLGRPGESALDPGPAREWALFRGTPGRSGQGKGRAPGAEMSWSQTLVRDRTASGWVQEAVRLLETRGQAVLPGFSPVAASGRIVYRSHRGIHAVDARSGEPLWESPSPWALELLAQEPSHLPYAGQWVSAHLQHSPPALLENSVVGTLSTNGSLVFAVDDLAVPFLPHSYQGFAGRQGAGVKLALAPELTDAIYHNRLCAIDLESGRVVWEVGRRLKETAAGSPLDGCWFLGPPLPLAGKLYVLSEKGQELRLLCLDAASGDWAWTQPLAVPQKNLLLDSARRVHAAHLACGEGVLVCPTNAGALIGVDLLTHSLLWAHLYRAEPPKPEVPPGIGRGRVPLGLRPGVAAPPSCQAEWKASAPLIHGGKVIHAAPDAPLIHCLRLRDGALAWKAVRADGDLYVAGVHNDKVLVVGRQECRALALADGKELWKVETGLPSGLGAAGGGVYYLPVKTKEPAILALDMDTGVVRGHTPLPQAVPGNLLFGEGAMISQTLTAVSAYPQVEEKPGE